MFWGLAFASDLNFESTFQNLWTNIENFNIFQVLSIQASFNVQQKIQILKFLVVCINLLERGLVYIGSRENLLPCT